MATRQSSRSKSTREAVRRRLVGTFKLRDNGHEVTVAISRDLEDTSFPCEGGEKVQVELVEEEGYDPVLELHPINSEK